MKLNEKLIERLIEKQEIKEKLNLEMPVVIEANSINVTFLCEQTGISRKSFYNKIKKKNFTEDELVRIAKVIN